jgi:hypothetical protein
MGRVMVGADMNRWKTIAEGLMCLGDRLGPRREKERKHQPKTKQEKHKGFVSATNACQGPHPHNLIPFN